MVITDGNAKVEAEEEEDISPYKLADHCKYLNLRTETTDSHQYWFCDWTEHFLQYNNPSLNLKGIVKDYCQPFETHTELQAHHVGLEPISAKKDDPYAVRTVSIRLRPDAKQHFIMRAVHQAFTALHVKHYLILKSTMHLFHAIGADGTVPLFLAANIITHKTNLERRLFLRFFHIDQVYLEEEQLQKIEGISGQKAPLQATHTRINTKLAEASALIQLVKEHGYRPSNDAPRQTKEEMSEFLQSEEFSSKSVLSIFYKEIKMVFPSLSTKDNGVFQESYPLMDRIWSELEMAKCTFNTMVTESSRFGMRPCQPTIDKDFCFHLSQISQLHMLLELQGDLEKTETVLHNTLVDYSELEVLLKRVLTEDYMVPVPEDQSSEANLDIGQTPIKMNKRKMEDFPWHPTIRKTLDDIAGQVAAECLQAFDPKVSLKMSDDAVDWVYSAFGAADDSDQKEFLKKRSRQSMIRITQQQGRVKRLLEKVILLPRTYPHLPLVTKMAEQWFEISVNAKTSNIRRSPIPIVVFKTTLGQGCVTSHQLILVAGVLRTEVQVFDWIDIDIKHTPSHPLTKITVLENGKRVTGFNPRNAESPVLVKICQTLKALQE
jgi:hypothetical protein